MYHSTIFYQTKNYLTTIFTGFEPDKISPMCRIIDYFVDHIERFLCIICWSQWKVDPKIYYVKIGKLEIKRILEENDLLE